MRDFFLKLLQALCGCFGGKMTPEAPPERNDEESGEEGFKLFGSFPLKDGNLLISELGKANIPFQVEFKDGIEGGVLEIFRVKAGHLASVNIYIEENNWGMLNKLVEQYYHQPWTRGRW